MNYETINTVRNNILELMRLKEIPSGNAFAKISGVSQRTINNIISPDETPNPSIRTLEMLSKTLSVELWMLLVPNFPFSKNKDLELKTLSREGYYLIKAFEKSKDQTKLSILTQMSFMLKEIEGDLKSGNIISETARKYTQTTTTTL